MKNTHFFGGFSWSLRFCCLQRHLVVIIKENQQKLAFPLCVTLYKKRSIKTGFSVTFNKKAVSQLDHHHHDNKSKFSKKAEMKQSKLQLSEILWKLLCLLLLP